jgi:hypothetical protein
MQVRRGNVDLWVYLLMEDTPENQTLLEDFTRLMIDRLFEQWGSASQS